MGSKTTDKPTKNEGKNAKNKTKAKISLYTLIHHLRFYLIILITGILASRLGRKHSTSSALEESVVAGRRINTVVGILTMTGRSRDVSIMYQST